MPAIRVLIADDSPFVCRMLTTHLHASSEFRVIGRAANGAEAVEMARRLRPDAITLDVDMPVMDGLTALDHIMCECPTPVIMLSGISREAADVTLQAIHRGAVDFILKYTPGVDTDPEVLRQEIVSKVRSASQVKVVRSLSGERAPGTPKAAARSTESVVTFGSITRSASSPLGVPQRASVTDAARSVAMPAFSREVVVIGASTGGPSALQELLSELPADFPIPVLVVQHMPATFTGVLAAQLDRRIALRVREAKVGDRLEVGTVFVTPGDQHLLLNNNLMIELNAGPKISGHRPSIDVTMQSVTQLCGGETTGVLLTGMGDDGAAGLSLIHAKRGTTYAQNRESCVVFGMPRRAIEMGAADFVASPREIGRHLAETHGGATRPLHGAGPTGRDSIAQGAALGM